VLTLTLPLPPPPPPQNTDGEAPAPPHPPRWPALRICAGSLGRRGPKDVVSLDIAAFQTCNTSELAAWRPLAPGYESSPSVPSCSSRGYALMYRVTSRQRHPVQEYPNIRQMPL